MRLISVLLFFNVFIIAKGQLSPLFTHYTYNTISINPAYAGTRERLTITGLHRSQWASIEGAPQTQTVTVHSPVLFKNSACGLSILNDKIGPTNSFSANMDISYTIRINEGANLALGLKGGFYFHKTDLNKMNIKEQNDPLFNKNIKETFIPNFGFGFYYYTEKYYAGFSIPKLLNNSNHLSNENSAFNGEKKHFFLIAGTHLKITRDKVFSPSCLIRYTKGTSFNADITASFIFDKSFRLGMSFRTGDAIGILTGLMLSKQTEIGYSFDWSYANKTGRYNYGSHEIMLRYDVYFKKVKVVKSPRYF